MNISEVLRVIEQEMKFGYKVSGSDGDAFQPNFLSFTGTHSNN